MKKLALGIADHCLAQYQLGIIADDHSKPMTKAAAVLDQTIADGRLNFAVAAVGNAGGQTWSHAAGYQDAEKTNVASPDNIIQIASMTKLVTTIAALQLVEQGKLNLDSPISAYAPELNDLQVLKGFEADETPIFEERNAHQQHASLWLIPRAMCMRFGMRTRSQRRSTRRYSQPP